LGQKDYFCFGDDIEDLPSSLDSVETGQANIHQNQIGSQFLRFLNAPQPVSRLADYLQASLFVQQRSDVGAVGLEILHDKYPHKLAREFP